MTNETKPKIKGLKKKISNEIIRINSDCSIAKKTVGHPGLGTIVTEWGSLLEEGKFDKLSELLELIFRERKQLRKENKKLKMVLASSELAVNLVQAVTFPSLTLKLNPVSSLPDNLQPFPQPTALFKCAKTNKPSNDGIYGVIYRLKDTSNYRFQTTFYEFGAWGIHDVLAFTETGPQEIINALNK